MQGPFLFQSRSFVFIQLLCSIQCHDSSHPPVYNVLKMWPREKSPSWKCKCWLVSWSPGPSTVPEIQFESRLNGCGHVLKWRTEGLCWATNLLIVSRAKVAGLSLFVQHVIPERTGSPLWPEIGISRHFKQWPWDWPRDAFIRAILLQQESWWLWV